MSDSLVISGHVSINSKVAGLGDDVGSGDIVRLDNKILVLPAKTTSIILNKPVGYVCSRNGQGSSTIYELLPSSLKQLKTVGRLDKDSSGLILLTNDGDLAQKLTHPKYLKAKVYEVVLDKALGKDHASQLSKGLMLEDGLSQLKLKALSQDLRSWQVTMHEGRNRQIRRTFEALGYRIKLLNRVKFGEYSVQGLGVGSWRKI